MGTICMCVCVYVGRVKRYGEGHRLEIGCRGESQEAEGNERRRKGREEGSVWVDEKGGKGGWR